MAVVRNGNMWAYEWQIDGKQVRRSTGKRVDEVPREALRGEPEARAKAKAMRELQAYAPSNAPRLLSAAERLYDEYWSKKRDSETPMQRLVVIAEVIGNKPIDQITSDDLQDVKDYLYSLERTPATVNRYMAAITKLLRHAWKYWRVIDAVPAVMKEDESGNERVRVVEYEEEDKILWACEKLGIEDFADLFVVLINTGLRKSEALNLTYRRNIDLDQQVVTVYGPDSKGKTTRSVPLNTHAQEVLARRLSVGEKPFSMFTSDMPLYWLDRAVQEAGLPTKGEDRIVLHSLRHTFASRLLRAGKSIYDVKELLGHKSVTTTERYYAHMIVDPLRDTVAALERPRKASVLELTGVRRV